MNGKNTNIVALIAGKSGCVCIAYSCGRSLKLQGKIKKRIAGKVTNQNVKVRKIDRKIQSTTATLTPIQAAAATTTAPN